MFNLDTPSKKLALDPLKTHARKKTNVGQSKTSGGNHTSTQPKGTITTQPNNINVC